MLGADDPALRTIVGAAVDMLHDNGWKLKFGQDRCGVEVQVDVDPLATVLRPGLAPGKFLGAGLFECVLDGTEVIAEHLRPYRGAFRRSRRVRARPTKLSRVTISTRIGAPRRPGPART